MGFHGDTGLLRPLEVRLLAVPVRLARVEEVHAVEHDVAVLIDGKTLDRAISEQHGGAVFVGLGIEFPSAGNHCGHGEWSIAGIRGRKPCNVGESTFALGEGFLACEVVIRFARREGE